MTMPISDIGLAAVNAAMKGFAPGTNTNPAPAGGRLDSIWNTAVKALHSGKNIGVADLDAYVNEETSGAIPSFAELSRVRQVHQRVATGQEVHRIATPSAGLTALESGVNAAGLGLAGKLDPGARQMLAAGEAAHPWAAAGGQVAGALAPGMLAAEAVPAAAIASRLGLPGVLQLAARGAIQGAAAGGTGAYAASPDIVPHPVEIAKGLGAGALVGAPLGAAGGWAALKLEPGEHLLGRAVQEATPGETPAVGAGEAAIRGGTTTPSRVGPPAAGVIHQPLSDAAIAQLPEELRPLNFERAPSLRALAAKEITKSAQASADAEAALREKLGAVITAKRALYNDPAAGYDALLVGKPIQDPAALDLFKKQTGSAEPPDARAVFSLAKRLDSKADAAFKQQSMGTGSPNLELAEAQGHMATQLRAVLSQEVPGFDALQARVAPYIARQRELQMAQRQIIGRAVKPLGKTAPVPKGKLLDEGMAETYGYTPSQITERTARQLVDPLFRSSSMDDVMGFIRHTDLAQKYPDLLRDLPGIAGSPAGAMQARRAPPPGLLEPTQQ